MPNDTLIPPVNVRLTVPSHLTTNRVDYGLRLQFLSIKNNDFPFAQRLHHFRRDTPAILSVGDKEHVTGEECPDGSCNILCLRLIERRISKAATFCLRYRKF